MLNFVSLSSDRIMNIDPVYSDDLLCFVCFICRAKYKQGCCPKEVNIRIG